MKPDGARGTTHGRLLAMAQRIAHADPVLDRVYPSLVELRDATKETVVFAKLSQDARVVYLDVLDSRTRSATRRSPVNSRASTPIRWARP